MLLWGGLLFYSEIQVSPKFKRQICSSTKRSGLSCVPVVGASVSGLAAFRFIILYGLGV